MAVRILFNPIIAFIFFLAGMGLATIHVAFGSLSIIGGLLFGFSLGHNGMGPMNEKTKVLFYGGFVFFLILFLTAFFIMTSILI